MTERILAEVKPEEFTSQITSDGQRYPFFEVEDGGGYIGYGHIETREFADALLAYWDETDPDGYYEDPLDEVTHTYGVAFANVYGDWEVETKLDNVKVTAETPNAIPLTTVWQ